MCEFEIELRREHSTLALTPSPLCRRLRRRGAPSAPSAGGAGRAALGFGGFQSRGRHGASRRCATRRPELPASLLKRDCRDSR